MVEQKKTMLIVTVIWWTVLAIAIVVIGHLMYNELAVLDLEPDKLAEEQAILLKTYGIFTASMIVLYLITIPIHRTKNKSRKEKFILEMMLSLITSAVAVSFTVLFIGKAGMLLWMGAIVSEAIINAILVNISHNVGRWIMNLIQDYKEGGLQKVAGAKTYDIEDYDELIKEERLSIKDMFKELLGFGEHD